MGAFERSSRTTSVRGRVPPEIFAELNILNVGISYIFRVNMTYVSVTLVRRVALRVSEDYTHNDRYAIWMEIKGESKSKKNSHRVRRGLLE